MKLIFGLSIIFSILMGTTAVGINIWNEHYFNRPFYEDIDAERLKLFETEKDPERLRKMVLIHIQNTNDLGTLGSDAMNHISSLAVKISALSSILFALISIISVVIMYRARK